MNAAERAIGWNLASKIAAVVNLFKHYWPEAKADLKPWHNDPDTRELVDPYSLDIGFHLPGWSRRWQCRSILVQIRFHPDPDQQTKDLKTVIGLDLVGFNHTGEVWQLSTIDTWTCEGETPPHPEIADRLREFCRQVFQLFQG